MVPVVQDAIRKTMVSAKNEAAKMGFTPPKNPFVTNADGRLTLGQSEDGSEFSLVFSSGITLSATSTPSERVSLPNSG